MSFMEGEKDRFIEGWQVLMTAGFAASFITVAAYPLVRQVPVAIAAGAMIGVPTGIGVSLAKTSFLAMGWGGGFSVFSKPSSPTGKARRRLLCPYLAFLTTAISISALSADCSKIFFRAIAYADNRESRFQFSIAEALALSIMFAICLGSAIWWNQQAPELFEAFNSLDTHVVAPR
jgi:hypothetical protein